MNDELKKELQKYLSLSDVSMIYNYYILLSSLSRKDVIEADIQYLIKFKFKEYKSDPNENDIFNSIILTVNQRYNRDVIQPMISKWNNLINESR